MKRSTKNNMTTAIQVSGKIMEKISALALVLGLILILTSGYREPVLTQIAWWIGTDQTVVYTADETRNFTAFADNH